MLLTSVSGEYGQILIHGVRTELLKAQARELGIPLQIIEMRDTPSMEAYAYQMKERFVEMEKQGVTHIIYGDIFLEDLRLYRETLLSGTSI